MMLEHVRKKIDILPLTVRKSDGNVPLLIKNEIKEEALGFAVYKYIFAHARRACQLVPVTKWGCFIN